MLFWELVLGFLPMASSGALSSRRKVAILSHLISRSAISALLIYPKIGLVFCINGEDLEQPLLVVVNRKIRSTRACGRGWLLSRSSRVLSPTIEVILRTINLLIFWGWTLSLRLAVERSATLLWLHQGIGACGVGLGVAHPGSAGSISVLGKASRWRNCWGRYIRRALFYRLPPDMQA